MTTQLQFETIARDQALDLFEVHRGELLAQATAVAWLLAKKHGRVTSTEVLAELRKSHLRDAVAAVDPRFMGGVFRGDDWRRIGFESTGSHRRPVSVWRLAE